MNRLLSVSNYIGGLTPLWKDFLENKTNLKRLHRLGYYQNYANAQVINKKLDEINKVLENIILKLDSGSPISRTQIRNVEKDAYEIPPPPPLLPKLIPITTTKEDVDLRSKLIEELREVQQKRLKRLSGSGSLKTLIIGKYRFLLSS